MPPSRAPWAPAVEPRPEDLVSARIDAYDKRILEIVKDFRNGPEGRAAIAKERKRQDNLQKDYCAHRLDNLEMFVEKGWITEGHYLSESKKVHQQYHTPCGFPPRVPVPHLTSKHFRPPYRCYQLADFRWTGGSEDFF